MTVTTNLLTLFIWITIVNQDKRTFRLFQFESIIIIDCIFPLATYTHSYYTNNLRFLFSFKITSTVKFSCWSIIKNYFCKFNQKKKSFRLGRNEWHLKKKRPKIERQNNGVHCVYVGFFVIVFPIYSRGNGTKAQRQRNIMHIINNSMGLVSLIIAIVREWERASKRAS